MMSIQYGSVTGQTIERSRPVTAALRSPSIWGFFSALRYSHSQHIALATETIAAASARKPKR